MGRGNCCVFGKHEGLYYVDYDNLHIYSLKNAPKTTQFLGEIQYSYFENWEYDEFLSASEYDYFIETFSADLIDHFPSFSKCDLWISRDRHAILENKLFFICTEDNEWSVAIELIAKDDSFLTGLQAGLYLKFLNGIRDALFLQFETIGIYAGAWTSGRIERPRELLKDVG